MFLLYSGLQTDYNNHVICENLTSTVFDSLPSHNS